MKRVEPPGSYGIMFPTCLREFRGVHMGSSREYWLYAKECAKWAAETKDREDKDLFLDMAKAWTNIALVEGDVDRLAPQELSKAWREIN
jgi:hypothetical protein